VIHARRVAIPLMAASLALLMSLGPPAAAGATGAPGANRSSPQLPQLSAARQAAQWLAGKLTPQGYIPTTPGSSQPDFSTTAQTVLALSAADVDPAGARQALAYLEANVDGYVTEGGADGPGQLALLILDAESLGVNPADFGGTDLVTRLLDTEQTSGVDSGLFGTETQVATLSAGGYQQGLALAALAAAGVRGTAEVTAAVHWLVAEQCPDGGWTTPDNAVNPCSGAPATYAGPDTNSTSLAVEGLAAQGAITPAVSSAALAFLSAGQDPDGGWSYYPNSTATPGTTDPDSTALVIQGLLALGSTPTGSMFTKGTATPVSTLLSFQLASGRDAGGIYFPPTTTKANILATYQAVPALAGLAIPFGPSGGSYWLAGADGTVAAFGSAGSYGSLSSLGVSADDVTAITATADGRGYWLTGADGGVFGFGDAGFYGSLPGLGVHVADIVGAVDTSDGAGYWLVGADGGVFAFGDAGYYGSLPGLGVRVGDIVGSVPTPDGAGYWLVGADGGVFAFGDAGYYGSLPGLGVRVGDIVGSVPTPDGAGYWLVGADGGVFAFGDAGYVGSLPGLGVAVGNVVGMAPTADAAGYYLASSTGGVFAFGDAVFAGSAGATGVSDIVGIAVSSVRPARSTVDVTPDVGDDGPGGS
jgi:hypothetical protein